MDCVLLFRQKSITNQKQKNVFANVLKLRNEEFFSVVMNRRPHMLSIDSPESGLFIYDEEMWQIYEYFNANLIWIRHSHEEEIPVIIIHIDETGRLNEPHEKCLQALMVLSEPWTRDIHLKWWTAD